MKKHIFCKRKLYLNYFSLSKYKVFTKCCTLSFFPPMVAAKVLVTKIQHYVNEKLDIQLVYTSMSQVRMKRFTEKDVGRYL